MSNRLARSLSPYLLQHADNPVDWHEWGDEAFERAHEEAKPVFLSIGYATCHWCHVMAHESFEDDEVAALINEHFIPIKLDREERPDIDQLYMTVCQAVTGQGGWPLTVFLTPDQKPFYVGTYFPKHGRGNRPGMMELLPAVARAWDEGRHKVVESAEQLLEAVRSGLEGARGETGEISHRALDEGFNGLASRFDQQHGGFGPAPKFPTPHNLLFLLREQVRKGDDFALQMVSRTLTKMRLGGIWDHVGFGFHRYSTDRLWKLPHFEKMLYDQALCAMAYTEAWHLTREPLFRETTEQIFEYVRRELTSPEGAFFSAEDADSLNAEGEMEEGAFYVWTWEEMEEVLSKEDAAPAIALFTVEREGNYLDEATQQPTGSNVLHLNAPLPELASRLGIGEEELRGRLERIRDNLLAAREARPRPLLDDKILTDWNGLMIAALAKAAWAFDEPAFAERAAQAAEFVLTTLRTDDGRLLHRYREGQAGIAGLADDYAFMAWGLIELYEATFEPRWLREAAILLERLLEHFWDDDNGGLFLSPDDGERLLVRQKAYYDGATPSANSVAAYVLVRAAHLTGRIEWEERAAAILNSTADIERLPIGHTMALIALQLLEGPPREIVIAGDPQGEDTRALVEVLRERFMPDAVWHLRGPEPGELAEVAPFTAAQAPLDGRAAAYVCERFACQAPVMSPEELRAMLQGQVAPG